jgi:farnesyl-diphosphate farnesyltransferase
VNSTLIWIFPGGRLQKVVLFCSGNVDFVGGENEADRQLLVEFDVVIAEYGAIDKKYREVIQDITKRMGGGMADYANNAAHNLYGVDTIPDFDLYCYYVAGLVGEGLTRLFISSGKENPKLSEAHD